MRRPGVLVVDDDHVLLRVLSMQFEQEGYAVRTASDGRRALEAMREEHPDVVILDAMMPDMGGVEVCRRIRADPELAAITILVLTAHSALEEPSFAAGADGFVSKPYDLRSLSTQVSELVALRALEVGPG